MDDNCYMVASFFRYCYSRKFSTNCGKIFLKNLKSQVQFTMGWNCKKKLPSSSSHPCSTWRKAFFMQTFGIFRRSSCHTVAQLDYFDMGDCSTGLFWGGRFYYWTFLLWEIVVLDYFEVGESTAGLFYCGRLWYWTILLWEILLLDFLAVGDSDAGLSS